ncbi:MAG: hypothetical protein WC752_01120 [Patescibacteria group bacterium]|jgi:hypothetical protein
MDDKSKVLFDVLIGKPHARGTLLRVISEYLAISDQENGKDSAEQLCAYIEANPDRAINAFGAWVEEMEMDIEPAPQD